MPELQILWLQAVIFAGCTRRAHACIRVLLERGVGVELMEAALAAAEFRDHAGALRALRAVRWGDLRRRRSSHVSTKNTREHSRPMRRAM